jgi:hypothetical protein
MHNHFHTIRLTFAPEIFLYGALSLAVAFLDIRIQAPPGTSMTWVRDGELGLGSATLRKTEKPVYTTPDRDIRISRAHAHTVPPP